MINSVFTTARVENFSPVWFQEHFLRLKQASLELDFNYDFSDFKEKVFGFIKEQGEDSCRLQLVLDRFKGLTLNLFPLPQKFEKYSVRLKEIEFSQGKFKRFPFLSHVSGHTEEVILIERSSGTVLEGSYNNVFINIDDVFFTPKADGRIVDGICRRKFIYYLKLKKITVVETNIDADMLKKGDLYFTNALRGVIKGSLF